MLERLYRSPKVRGALRVAAFLGVANLTLTALWLRQARANAEESVQRSGLALMQQLGPHLIGLPEVATINGQRMSLGSATTTLGVEQALGQFEQYCHQNSGDLAQELRAIPDQAKALDKLPESFRDPASWLTSRQGGGDGKAGQIVCVARKGSGGGLNGLFERALAFAKTGDLSEIGDARYFVARRDEAAGNTHVLAMWTEGRFNIPQMFPNAGDAPGSDSRDVPRPPLSRRVLSAEIVDHPYSLRMYDTDDPQAKVLTFYEQQLVRRGYKLTRLPVAQDAELNLDDYVRAFSKNGAAVIVVVGATPKEQTGVTLIEMGGAGFAVSSAGRGLPR